MEGAIPGLPMPPMRMADSCCFFRAASSFSCVSSPISINISPIRLAPPLDFCRISASLSCILVIKPLSTRTFPNGLINVPYLLKSVDYKFIP